MPERGDYASVDLGLDSPGLSAPARLEMELADGPALVANKRSRRETADGISDEVFYKGLLGEEDDKLDALEEAGSVASAKLVADEEDGLDHFGDLEADMHDDSEDSVFWHCPAALVRAVLPSIVSHVAVSTVVGAGQACSCGLRGFLMRYNEDRIALIAEPASAPGASGRLHACVFDGHGGAAAAQYLSDHFVAEVQHQTFQKDAGERGHALAFSGAYARVNDSLRAESVLDGSTAVTALLDGSMLHVGNVGDSFCLVMHAGGGHQVLTTEHRASSDCLADVARVEAEGGCVDKSRPGDWRVEMAGHPGRGGVNMTRAFGDFAFPGMSCEPHVASCTLGEDDLFVVLGSDGVTESMSYLQIAAYVARKAVAGYDVHQLAAKLVRRAIKQGSVDNVSAIVVSVTDYLAGRCTLLPPAGGAAAAVARAAPAPAPAVVEPESARPAAQDECVDTLPSHTHANTGSYAAGLPPAPATAACGDPSSTGGGPCGQPHCAAMPGLVGPGAGTEQGGQVVPPGSQGQQAGRAAGGAMLGQREGASTAAVLQARCEAEGTPAGQTGGASQPGG